MEVQRLRILQLHSDFLEYKIVEKEISLAEEPKKKQDRLEELAVLFTSVEEGDDLNDCLSDQLMYGIHPYHPKCQFLPPLKGAAQNLSRRFSLLTVIRREVEQAKGRDRS